MRYRVPGQGARAPLAAIAVVSAALLPAALVGCARKEGSGGRLDDAERASGAASFRLADANVVVRAAPARLVNSGAFGGLVDRLEGIPGLGREIRQLPERMSKELLGVGPSEIEGLVVSVDTNEAMNTLLAAVTGDAVDPAATLRAISEASGEELKESGTHEGVSLHAPEGDAEEGALAFPDDRLLVTGRPREVRRGIDNYEAGRPVEFRGGMAELLSRAPRAADIVVAVIPTPELLDRVRRAQPMMRAGLKDADRFESLLVAATAGDALEVTLRMTARTEEGAREARKGIDDLLRGAEDWAAGAADRPTMRPLVELVRSVKTGGMGRAVEVVAPVRPEVVDILRQLLESPAVKAVLERAASGMPAAP